MSMIYDCFTYFNDDLITELRLNTLNKFVDKFIIVEATTDHFRFFSLKKKKLNFDLKKFEKFKDKIKYIIVEDFFKIQNHSTTIEEYGIKIWLERNIKEIKLSEVFQDAKDDDLIIISDNDEIPDLRALQKIEIKKYAVFNQNFYRYKFNLLSEAQTPYQGSRIIKKNT